MKSLAKNYIMNLLYQMLVVILPLLTAPYLARILGADRIGEYSFVQSIVSYFVLISVMGTALYGQRKIATCYAKGEPTKQVFTELVILRAAGVSIALVAYYLLIFPTIDNQWLYLVASIEILAVVFDISWFYQGIEQFSNITLCNAISKLIALIAIFLFVKTQDDLELYVLIYCGSILLGNAAQWYCLPGSFRDDVWEKPNIFRHLKPTLGLFVSQFAIQAYTILDKTMIGLITGSDYENGYYDQSQKLIKALSALVNSIGSVMASRIAIVWNISPQQRKQKVEQLILFSFRLVFAISLPVAAGTIVIASRFVPVFYGNGYEPVVQLIQILSIIVPVIGCSNIIGMQLFVPSGREYLLTRSVIMGAFVNVVINMILITQMGALGAALASVIAELTVTGVQMFYSRQEIPLMKVLLLFLRYLSFSIFIATLGSLISMLVDMSVIGLFAIVTICVAVYMVLLLVIKDPVIKNFSM